MAVIQVKLERVDPNTPSDELDLENSDESSKPTEYIAPVAGSRQPPSSCIQPIFRRFAHRGMAAYLAHKDPPPLVFDDMDDFTDLLAGSESGSRGPPRRAASTPGPGNDWDEPPELVSSSDSDDPAGPPAARAAGGASASRAETADAQQKARRDAPAAGSRVPCRAMDSGRPGRAAEAPHVQAREVPASAAGPPSLDDRAARPLLRLEGGLA